MMRLAVDPGVDTGWCLFTDDGRLHSCGLNNPPQFAKDAQGVSRADDWVEAVVIEKPQVYTARLSKGNPNDLITLALQVGRYIERFESRGARVEVVTPTEWKGQCPKEIMATRAQGLLSEVEKRVVAECMKSVAKSKQHNVWDALALGQWAWKTGKWKRVA